MSPRCQRDSIRRLAYRDRTARALLRIAGADVGGAAQQVAAPAHLMIAVVVVVREAVVPDMLVHVRVGPRRKGGLARGVSAGSALASGKSKRSGVFIAA